MKIWLKADAGDITAASVLILIYTGMRPGELLSLELSTHIYYHSTRMYFKTESKTEADKNRIIPIPDAILKYILELISGRTHGPLVATASGKFYRLDNLGVPDVLTASWTS